MRYCALGALLSVCAVSAPATGAVEYGLRLFWSETGPGEGSPIELLESRVPVVTQPGVARMFLWATVTGFAPSQKWVTVNLDFRLDGPASIVDFEIYNPTIGGVPGEPLQRRWAGTNEGSPSVPPGASFVSGIHMGASVNEYGITKPVKNDGFSDMATQAVVLARADFDYSGTKEAGMFLIVGQGGLKHNGVSPFQGDVNFGFGDAPVPINDIGCDTELADIIFIPEPGSMLLVGLGLLGMAKSRRRVVNT